MVSLSTSLDKCEHFKSPATWYTLYMYFAIFKNYIHVNWFFLYIYFTLRVYIESHKYANILISGLLGTRCTLILSAWSRTTEFILRSSCICESVMKMQWWVFWPQPTKDGLSIMGGQFNKVVCHAWPVNLSPLISYSNNH